MRWWCSALDAPWEWTWQPYPGVWLFALSLLGVYGVALAARWQRTRQPPATRGQGVCFTLGVLVLWTVTDWPLGPLGSGYLLSVHTVKFIAYTMVAPPLLLAGTPVWLAWAALGPPGALRAARWLTHPVSALAVYNLVLVLSHWPAVIETLNRSQGGTFARDLLWLAAGLLLWWPVVSPLPALPALSYPKQVVYLMAQTVVPAGPVAFLTFATYPIYALYELAPRVWGLPASTDQQIAGLTMKTVGGFLLAGWITVRFFQWSRAAKAGEPSLSDRVAAPPR